RNRAAAGPDRVLESPQNGGGVPGRADTDYDIAGLCVIPQLIDEGAVAAEIARETARRRSLFAQRDDAEPHRPVQAGSLYRLTEQSGGCGGVLAGPASENAAAERAGFSERVDRLAD